MTKIYYFLISIVCAFNLISCTNEIEEKAIQSNNQQINLYGVHIENVDGMLAFASKGDIEKIFKGLPEISRPINIPQLRSTSTGGTNLTSISPFTEIGFRSLYDVFVDAMNEAEDYYERPGGYEEFKSKYPTLYFPEEGDDYSAYLPISDKELAKIANINGNVIIDGEVISLIDINSYDKLRELGQTPPSNTTTLRATSGTNSISEEKNASGQNKVWVNSHISYVGTTFNPIVVVEVCFRKKGALGIWYNHNSGSDAHLDLGSSVNLGYYEGTDMGFFGFSSHDYKYAIRTGTGPAPTFGFVSYPVNAYVIIYHNGTGKTLTLHVSRPAMNL